jgi:Tol biopolymer transport system component
VQLTRNGGWVGFESPDGKYLYYATNPWGATLYRIPVDGGTEQRIAEPFWGVSLVVAKSGLYHALPSPRGPVIYFRSFLTGRTTTVATIPSFYWFMSVSPDERYLLYSMAERTGSDLMLVENFR